MKQRLVSVIVPTRNRPQLLRKALASIRALEGPDLKFEILVGDNGDIPDNKLIAEEFGAIYGHTTTNGGGAARNVAFRKATGEFIAFLDDDDEWLAGNIRPQIAFLDANSDHEAAFGQVVFCDDKLKPEDEQWIAKMPANGDVFRMMMGGYFPQLGASVARGDAVKKYGLMDESLLGDQDWEWQIRIASKAKVGILDEPCVLFRGRPPGSSDALLERRVGFTRRVFFRHLWPNLSHWKSPVGIAASYFGAMNNYFWYFLDAARIYAGQGKRGATLKAFWLALTIFPSQFARQLVKDRTVRSALVSALAIGRMRKPAYRFDGEAGSTRV